MRVGRDHVLVSTNARHGDAPATKQSTPRSPRFYRWRGVGKFTEMKALRIPKDIGATSAWESFRGASGKTQFLVASRPFKNSLPVYRVVTD